MVRVTLVVGAAIVRQGRVLAARRTYPPAVAGRWEFPGGKQAPGETPEQSLIREVSEELATTIAVVGWLPGEVALTSPDTPAANGHLVLRIGLARLTGPEPQPTEHDALRWLCPDELDDVDWLEPDRPFLSALRAHLP
ncbi:MAG: (deoxy)nucleoside triphosphate pyrophosphohydrolase [Micropruina sp.]|nr:(deoxy)nucleoside triphosphate pyrophosphohydrolase [Micropruina sp.]